MLFKKSSEKCPSSETEGHKEKTMLCAIRPVSPEGKKAGEKPTVRGCREQWTAPKVPSAREEERLTTGTSLREAKAQGHSKWIYSCLQSTMPIPLEKNNQLGELFTD